MIPMNAFKREPESLIQAEIKAVEKVIRSGWWILGNEVTAFESEWSNFSKSAHSVGVGNGMDALEIGLRALGIGNGDEVITTPMTAFATVLAIFRAGATPVLADIDPETAILSIESVQRCINVKTKAVIVVHLYGRAAPLSDFEDVCKRNGILLIEDCAQSHGAVSGDKPVGSVGAFAGWSFYPTKNLGAIGDGGALSTQSKEIAEKAKEIRNYGQSVRYHHPQIGLNSRLDEIQAAILRERLKYLSEWTRRRIEIAGMYNKGILNPLVKLLPINRDTGENVYHLYVITCSKRDILMSYLKENQIETLIHYPIPVHQQIPCKDLKKDPCGLGNAEKHACECVSLPCNPFLTNDEITNVIDTINKFRG